MTLPRLGFNITGIGYDPARKTNKLRKRKYQKSDGTSEWSYNEVPYNISFGLYAFSRNMDDNLQIIENILPYFSPEFIVTIKESNINILLMGNATLSPFLSLVITILFSQYVRIGETKL